VIPSAVAVAIAFDASPPITPTGYKTGVTLTTTNCSPSYMHNKRGIYFAGNDGTNYVEINNIEIYKDFTVAMWIRPVEGDGSLFSFNVNRDVVNGNVFVSSCFGLAVFWAGADLSTAANVIST
jgi:hypothetical protein